MSSGCYSLYNDVLVINGKKLTFRIATFFRYRSLESHYRWDSLLLWKDIGHPLVFINFLGRLRPVVAYS